MCTPIYNSQDTEATHLEGEHGNPCQCSYVENLRDTEAWWVTVHRVTKIRTQPKQFNTHINVALCCTLETQHCKLTVLKF